jgi:hypothetical protein
MESAGPRGWYVEFGLVIGMTFLELRSHVPTVRLRARCPKDTICPAMAQAQGAVLFTADQKLMAIAKKMHLIPT